jgi:predicted PurR-regulated permease PerM
MGSTEQRPAGATTQRDPARVALVLIAIVVAAGVITYLGPILKPFLIAVFLYFATKSAAGVLIRLRFPSWLAYLVLFVIVVAVAAVLTLLVYSEAMALHDRWEGYQKRILALIGKAPGEGRSLSEIFKGSSKQVIKYVFERSLGILELLTMVFFYLLFILLGAARLTQRVHRAFPGERAEHLLSVAGKIGSAMEQFMKVKTLVSAGMGASAALIMYLCGLDTWLLWGVFFFLGNYITYVGSIAACGPPIVWGYLQLESPIVATVMAVLIVVNRFAWIDYIEIKMSGRHLNIDSVLLFLWLAYWGWMWGVVGLILAFPMITSLKIVLEHLDSTRSWAVMMSEE